MGIIRLLIVCFALLGASGCAESPVADDIGQRDAHAIIAVLRDHGIEATSEKARGGKGRYSVVVASSQFGEAVSILSKLGLPQERGASFGELVAPSGILPSSPSVEHLRLDRAMASELEDLILADSGISSVGVVVRYHALSAAESPAVSVVAQRRKGSGVKGDEVKTVVARVVPGIKIENISVLLSDEKGSVGGANHSEKLVPFLVWWKVPQGEYNELALVLLGLILLVSSLSGIGGYIYGQYVVSRTIDVRSPQRNGTRPRVSVPLDADSEEGR